MKKTLLSAIFTALISIGSFAQNSKAQQILNNTDKHYFIENKGQWHDDVLFLCRLGGLDAWITKYGVNYTFFKIEKTKENTTKEQIPIGKFDQDEWENALLLGHRVLMKLQNHNPEPQHEGKQKQQGYHNYLIGNDPSKHATFVGLYKEAVVKDVYNGIDLRYYFDQGSLRYDYIVHPGADPAQIQFTLEGQDNVYLKDDNLYFTTRFGEVAMTELYTYQGNRAIESRFEKQGNVWKITVSNYDPTQDLIIDPLLYSTYLGGSSSDRGLGIAVNSSGNAYITGYTNSTDYAITPGAFQTAIGGSYDVFVTQLNATGTGLLYSTYMGGSNNDYGYGIAVNGSGNAYITGNTSSTNYPVTPGAFQTIYGGNSDVFVTQLNATGTGLLYSTYMGGSNNDYGYGIAVNGSGNAYITGYTYSSDYPVTPGAFQTAFLGGYIDAFVSKLNTTGSGLVYSTYIGGSIDDFSYGIAVDGSDNAYITGYTYSNDYDITLGAFQTAFGGGNFDAFVSKFNTTGSSLVYSTYIGGTSDDKGYGIAVDGLGNAYITGYTFSNNYPVTPGALKTANAGGADAFVTQLNTTGTGLLYSTYMGGGGSDYGLSIAADGSGNAYITGYTYSSNFVITSDAFQTNLGGNYDAFVSELNTTGSSLLYSTYMGGSNSDFGNGIALDHSGNAYITGFTSSINYPVTPWAFQTANGGGSWDAFVSKLGLNNTTNSITPVMFNNNDVRVYPNPTTGKFTIELVKNFTDVTIKITNTLGQLIYQDEFNSAETIPVKLEDNSKGIYFVRVYSGNKIIASVKIKKQ